MPRRDSSDSSNVLYVDVDLICVALMKPRFFTWFSVFKYNKLLYKVL